LELGTGFGVKKLELWSYRAVEEVLRYLQSQTCGYNAPTWHTDGRTLGESKDCAYA